ncbi:MAG: response regulator [Archangium sp.]|nr:response regulator [Archangium sp.]
MSDWLERIVQRFLPPALTGLGRMRCRFFVIANLVAFAFAAVSCVAFELAGDSAQAAANFLVLVGSGLALVWLRRRQKLTVPVHLAAWGAIGSCGLATLSTSPPDITNACIIAVVPLMAHLSLGRREAFRWLIICIAAGGIFIWLSRIGVSFHHGDPTPWISPVINIAMLTVVLWAFAGAYDSVYERALTEMEQVDAAKRTFLATVSHEIRTPMNGVLGLTEAMLAEPLSASQRENLLLIHRSGKLLISLISDLLDLTKAEARKLTIDIEDFRLDQLLDDVRGLFEPLAAKKGVALSVERDAAIAEVVRGDALRLGQVLNNLVNNAVKFTPSGEVRVVVRATSPTRVRFAVRDTGIGIEASVVPRLFSPFEQGDGTTTRRFGGTGLGLSLAQQLVTLMGSHIEVESEPGIGTVFAFELTLEPGVAPPHIIAPPAGVVATDATRKVLVVDDNPINLVVATQLVKHAGFTARQATSGAAALAALSEERFDVVLMDCHMPDMDGFQTTERIRALTTPYATVPVVALTASVLPEEHAACRRAGMNDVLVKPVSLETLSQMLRRYMPSR